MIPPQSGGRSRAATIPTRFTAWSQLLPISNLTVQNTIIKDVYVGVRGDGPTSGSAVTGSLITNNWFDSIGNFDFGYAVSLRTGFYADVTNNLMTRVWTGVHMNNFSLAGGPATWSVSGNTIQEYAAGVLYWLEYGSATHLTLDNNQISATTGAVANNFGILMVSVQNTDTALVTNNSISGTDYGVGLTNVSTSNTITLGATNSISGTKVAGVYLTDNLTFNPVGTTDLTTNAYTGPGNAISVAVTEMSITPASGIGVEVQASRASGNVATTAVITNDDIAGATTGILITGTSAGATITGVTIDDPTTGIEVSDGCATISGGAIYNNGTGIQFTADGSGSVSGVDFGDAGAGPVNGTDLQIDSTAGAVTDGGGNKFAGTQYIDNEAAGNIDATADTFSVSDNFVIEDRIYHKIDNAPSGLVTWVLNNVYVTPAPVSLVPVLPSPTNNDYTRMLNAVNAVSNGWTINLQGTFNWAEANAKAAWILGNDGLSGGSDDYSLNIPATLHDVTLTAPGGLGTATIQGPGWFPGGDFGVGIQFYDPGDGAAANNQNWTISNLVISNFTTGIGAFNGVPTNQMSGFTVSHNHIIVAADDPSDTLQTIGINLGFGKNQHIVNNIIDLNGDGGANTAEIGLQTNTGAQETLPTAC